MNYALDEILQIPWLDGIMIGPCDFSGSMGRLLDIGHPEQNALLDEAIQKCNAAGLSATRPGGIPSIPDISEVLQRI